MSTKIFDCILAYQQGDAEAALELIDRFKPLLKKYAHMLHQEDSYEALQCYLLELLKGIRQNDLHSTDDGAIITYTVRSVRNKYIAMSKEGVKANCLDYIDDMLPSMSARFERNHNHKDIYEALLKQDMKALLTDNEYNILIALYFEQWSVTEIAQRLQKSRQAINQAKNHALDKLRHAWNS